MALGSLQTKEKVSAAPPAHITAQERARQNQCADRNLGTKFWQRAISLYLAVTPRPQASRKRPIPARLFGSVFSFHFGFSAAVENLWWVQNISRTKRDASGGRLTSRRGSAAAFRKPNIAVSIDLTKRLSRAGSSILLAKKLHASLWK